MSQTNNFAKNWKRFPLLFAVTLLSTASPSGSSVFSQSCTRQPFGNVFVLPPDKPKQKTTERRKDTVEPVLVAARAPSNGDNVLASSPGGSGSRIRGKAIFEEKCARCHTVGGGVRVGPDLQGIMARAPRQWLIKFIMDTEEMFKNNDRIATQLLKLYGVQMPDVGLTHQETLDVLSYLANPKDMNTSPGMRGMRMQAGAASTEAVSESDSAGGSAQQGKSIFAGQCAGCHTIGGGRLAGPDLQGITKQRSHEWLVKFISDPEQMFSQNDPIATELLQEYKVKMPNLGLTKQQVLDVIAYLASPEGGQAARGGKPRGKQPQQEQVAADTTQQGYLYFTGDRMFVNGGPACKACHSIGGIPFPYGGTVGPSLSGIYSKMTAEGLRAALQNMPYPTMQPIFYQNPLENQEISDLIAFFEEADGREAPSVTLLLALPMAGGGLLLGMAAMWAIWHKRIPRVREQLLERVKGGKGIIP